MQRTKVRRVLPGFGLSMGFTLGYMSLIVLIPLSAVFFKASSLGPEGFWAAATAPRVVASYKLSFGASLLAGAINVVFGLMLAWTLVRYSFPGRRIVDALIDLPFALPTAVAGIALTALYAKNGWLGQYLSQIGIDVAFTPLGVLVALIFEGVPFVVRTVQPVLEDLDLEFEEAAASLGATRVQTFRRVVLPMLAPALLTGFALAFARAVGEYGSVIFIAGNIPMVSEITPLIIITKLEQYDYAGATAVAAVMLDHLVHPAAHHQRPAGLDRALEREGALDGLLRPNVRCRSLARHALRGQPSRARTVPCQMDCHRYLHRVLRDLPGAATPRRIHGSNAQGMGCLPGGDHPAGRALRHPADAYSRQASPCRSTCCSVLPRRGQSPSTTSAASSF